MTFIELVSETLQCKKYEDDVLIRLHPILKITSFSCETNSVLLTSKPHNSRSIYAVKSNFDLSSSLS
jgi:hypothetical protein